MAWVPNHYSMNDQKPENYIENFHPYTREGNFDLHAGLLREQPSTLARRLSYCSQLYPNQDSIYQVLIMKSERWNEWNEWNEREKEHKSGREWNAQKFCPLSLWMLL